MAEAMCHSLHSWSGDHLPLSHLEYVCVAQRRFPALLRASGRSSSVDPALNQDTLGTLHPLFPSTTRIFTPLDSSLTIYSICIIPGGRFLAMVTDNDLRFYDLGCHPSQWLSPNPVLVHPCGEQRGAFWVSLMFNKGPEGAIWSWLSMSKTGSPQTEIMFEITHLESAPSIRKISTLTLSGPHTGGYWPYGFDRLGLLCPSVATFYIWDFVNDSFGLIHALDATEMSITRSHIQLYDIQLRGLEVYNHPETLPIQAKIVPGASEMGQDAPPPLVKAFNWSRDMPDPETSTVTRSAWTSSYSPSGTEGHFDVIYFHTGEDIQDVLFTALHHEFKSLDDISTPIRTHMGTYNISQQSAFHHPISCTFPNGERLLWWFGNGEIRFHLSSLVEESYDEGLLGLLYQTRHGGPAFPVNWAGMTLDVGVGRLCLLHGAEIRVIDFVPWTT